MALDALVKFSDSDGGKVFVNVNKRFYIDNWKLDCYRKAELPEQDYDGFSLVGRGKKTRDKCGTHYGNFSCECGHKTKGRMNFCYEMSCPICFHKGIERTTKEIVKRFIKIKKAYKIINRSVRFYHISLNTYKPFYMDVIGKPEIENIDDFKKVRKKLNAIMRKYGMAGLLMVHPYRNENKLTDMKLKRFSHFHFIGSGYLPENKEFTAKHKFNYSKIKYVDKKTGIEHYDIKSKKHMFALVRYLLSHTASFVDKTHSYSWIGAYSHNSLKKVNVVHESEPLICEECESKVCMITSNFVSLQSGDYGISDIYVYELGDLLFDYEKYIRVYVDDYDLQVKGFEQVYIDYYLSIHYNSGFSSLARFSG